MFDNVENNLKEKYYVSNKVQDHVSRRVAYQGTMLVTKLTLCSFSHLEYNDTINVLFSY